MKYTLISLFLFLFFSVLFNFGCQKESQSPVSYIGELYGGGVTFYLDETGQHGFVCALKDLQSASWGCADSLIGTLIFGDVGQENTTAILIGCKVSGIAASLCDDFVSSGFDDWYLPSRSQLRKMHNNRQIINSAATENLGSITFYYNFIEANYWSSSEVEDSIAFAYSVDFGCDLPSCFGCIGFCWSKSNKDSIRHVRAVRSF